jgi:large subunit ribosomal protein L29
MPSDELRDATDEELVTKERELTESLFFLRLRHGTNQLDSPAKLGQTRREIARIKTIRRARELAAAKG